MFHEDKKRAAAGIEPATSRTRNENHTTRPSSQTLLVDSYHNQNLFKSIRQLINFKNCNLLENYFEKIKEEI